MGKRRQSKEIHTAFLNFVNLVINAHFIVVFSSFFLFRLTPPSKNCAGTYKSGKRLVIPGQCIHQINKL
jgi:hypothetical protein